jgi:alkylation response protein AidB-like acyl-CoA dehydrogenase
MDLRYSDDDERFRSELRTWLEREVPRHGTPPPPGDWLARRAYDTAWQRTLHDAGYAGLHWPVEFGGRGLPVTQQLVYLEEYARSGAPYIGVNFVGLMHAGPTLIAEGTDAQRAFHLPRILRGESVWCQGFSEPQAGSDLASLRTMAVREGDEYVVNGQKIWSTRAHVADWCELLVRTDPSAPKHRGITWLILDMHQPGVEVRPMRTIDGESHFCEVFLTDARVPVANRVGDENDGWRVTNVTLRFERGTAFAQHIITLRTQLRAVVAMAQRLPAEPGHPGSEPGTPGATRWDDPALRAQVGRYEATVDALWRLTQRGIAEADATGLPPTSGSAVKLRYSELSQEIADLAMRVVGRAAVGGAVIDGVSGGDGVGIDGELVARDHLWSLQYTIAAGTSQIQRNLIAERILGMPRS